MEKSSIPKKSEYKLAEVAKHRLAGVANVKTLKKMIARGDLESTNKAPPDAKYTDIWVTAASIEKFKKRKGRDMFDAILDRSKKFSSAAMKRKRQQAVA